MTLLPISDTGWDQFAIREEQGKGASMAVSCCQSQEIPRVSASALSPAQFHAEYFLRARPVIITDAAEDWPARSWTIPGLVDRVGDNEVWVRGKTNQEDYRVGKVWHTVLYMENIAII